MSDPEPLPEPKDPVIWIGTGNIIFASDGTVRTFDGTEASLAELAAARRTLIHHFANPHV